jgi:hypothetical protein
MDEVVIEYQLTSDESRRALLGASPKTNRAFIFIMVEAAISAAALAIAHDQPLLEIFIVIIIADALVMKFWLAPKRYWKLTLGVQEPRTVTVDSQGIVSKSESVEERYEWSRFSGTRESSEFFFLLPAKNATGIALPKRGLRSTEDEAELRLLFESHAPLTTEDRILRRGLAAKLAVLSLSVLLFVFIYVEIRIH